jgi:hypothetical protein
LLRCKATQYASTCEMYRCRILTKSILSPLTWKASRVIAEMQSKKYDTPCYSSLLPGRLHGLVRARERTSHCLSRGRAFVGRTWGTPSDSLSFCCTLLFGCHLLSSLLCKCVHMCAACVCCVRYVRVFVHEDVCVASVEQVGVMHACSCVLCYLSIYCTCNKHTCIFFSLVCRQ